MNKKAMYNIVYGLEVLTARDGDKDNGCIINTMGQVTTSPNRITITVNKDTYTHDLVLKTGEFNVSLLDQTAPFSVFKNFGFQSGKDTDKFADFSDVYRSDNGIYYLTKYANAFVSGKVVSTQDLGTHTMFLADVTDGEVLSNEPSMSYAYYHASVKPKTTASRPGVKAWRCRICGYVYEGDELPDDFICPICKHGAIDFEQIQ